MSAEKLEAVYLVDRQFFLHIKETESGFQYEAFHRSDKKENYSGMLTWEDLLESRIASPLAAARVAACEEIGLEGQEVAKVSLLSLLPYPRSEIRRRSLQEPASLPSHDIRFIDSRYKELFRIPDGGTIQVDYPDRHYAAKCSYIDDYHTQVGNNVYHICQFAEILERGGGTCRPEPELDRDTAAWQLGSQNYLTVERSPSGWAYHLYDQGFHSVAAGEVGGLETSILEARDQAMEQCRLSSRNRELTDYDREEFHRREFMSQDKIEKWDEVNGNTGNNGRLETFLESAGDNYAILQLRDIEETRMERFSSLRMLERMDMEVNIDHYEVVYIAPLPIHTNRPAFLESVFEKFNLDRPDDFKGHSLSVSDIVAIRENGAVSCYYCDSTCFQELPGLIPENYLKNAEMQLEDDYGMIDGVVNNGAKDCKEKAAKDKAEKPSVVEQLKTSHTVRSERNPRSNTRNRSDDMGNDRYQMTLEEIPGIILDIRQKGALMGTSTNRIESGYLLSNGTALLENEKDENGFYVGGNYVNGEYLKSQERYEPVRNKDGAITGFRQMSAYLHQFSGEEQKLIFQYALNTKNKLLEDLEQILKIVKNQQLRQLVSGTCEKFARIPDRECIRLMADIRAAYKERNLESIRQRQKAAQRKPAMRKRKRSLER